MAHKDSPSLDHIDPCWEEGRDYQLVCGLDCDRNYRELTSRKNVMKSNRFLPWRYCADEIGQKPCETGDWVQFLVGFDIEKDIPGEWVLMEFESPEWFETTTKFSACVRGGKTSGKAAAEKGFFDLDSPNCIKTFNTLSAAGKIGGKIAGAKCRDEGIGWCGADEEIKREWKRRGGSISGRMPYWNNGIKNKRAHECPGDGWVRGRIKTWS
jgi:hypothetical protein